MISPGKVLKHTGVYVYWKCCLKIRIYKSVFIQNDTTRTYYSIQTFWIASECLRVCLPVRIWIILQEGWRNQWDLRLLSTLKREKKIPYDEGKKGWISAASFNSNVSIYWIRIRDQDTMQKGNYNGKENHDLVDYCLRSCHYFCLGTTRWSYNPRVFVVNCVIITFSHNIVTDFCSKIASHWDKNDIVQLNLPQVACDDDEIDVCFLHFVISLIKDTFEDSYNSS